MDGNTLSMLAAALLSLLCAYLPGLSGWYAALDGVQKRLMMAGLLLAVSVGIVALSCAGLASELGLMVTCDTSGILLVIQYFLSALIANQATYMLAARSRPPADTDISLREMPY